MFRNEVECRCRLYSFSDHFVALHRISLKIKHCLGVVVSGFCIDLKSVIVRSGFQNHSAFEYVDRSRAFRKVVTVPTGNATFRLFRCRLKLLFTSDEANTGILCFLRVWYFIFVQDEQILVGYFVLDGLDRWFSRDGLSSGRRRWRLSSDRLSSDRLSSDMLSSGRLSSDRLRGRLCGCSLQDFFPSIWLRCPIRNMRVEFESAIVTRTVLLVAMRNRQRQR
jgi:hypothetical protein